MYLTFIDDIGDKRPRRIGGSWNYDDFRWSTVEGSDVVDEMKKYIDRTF